MIIYTFKENGYAFNITSADSVEIQDLGVNCIAGGVRVAFSRDKVTAYSVADVDVPVDATVDGLYNGEVVDGEATKVDYTYIDGVFTKL